MCGAVIVSNQILFVMGFYLTNSTTTGVIQPMNAIFVCIMSMMLGKEEKSWMKLLGTLIAVIGAISMLVTSALMRPSTNAIIYDTLTDNYSPLNSAPTFFNMLQSSTSTNYGTFMLGMILLVANTFGYAVFLILQKGLLSEGIPPITVTCWSFILGLSVSSVFALYFSPATSWRRIDWMTVIGMLYACMPYGVIQFIFSAQASQLSTPTIVGIYSTLQPMLATVTGVLAFGETVSLWILIGAAMIVFGVLFVIGARYLETRKQIKLAPVVSSIELEEQDIEKQ